MAKINIIVGSVMGTAQSIAESMRNRLEIAGHSIRIIDNFAETSPPASIKACDGILICTSTTGMGDLPANISPFLQHLLGDYPAIADLPFAVISLGDSSYPNFAQAGKTLRDALNDLGAKEVITPITIDAQDPDSGAEAALSLWASDYDKAITAIR